MNPKASPDPQKGFVFILRALRHRNYRIFFVGQGVSFVGTWIQQVALQWLVYRLTGSPWLLGLVGFCGQIPSFFVSPFAGVFVDRWDRRRILLLTQTLSMLQAAALSVLFFSGRITVNEILLLALFIGVVNALDAPARQSLVIDMVDGKEDLGNAIALNSSMVHAARLIGPLIAGVVIAKSGEGACFLLNAVSFMAVIVSLGMMRLKPRPVRGGEQHPLLQLKEGVRYVAGHRPIRSYLLLLGIVSLCGMPYMVLLPVFAKDIFNGDAHTLGFLISALGLGALAGSFYLALRSSIKGFTRLVANASILFGLGLMTFAVAPSLWMAWGALALTGFGMMVQFAASNTVLQTIAPDDKRGRVMGFYTMTFLGVTPVGNLLAGAVAKGAGAGPTLLIGGMFCVLTAIWFGRQVEEIRADIRRQLYPPVSAVPPVPGES